MGFGEAISSCLSKYATISGRARRSEYWYFVLFNLLVQLAASVIDVSIGSGEFAGGVFYFLVSLALLLPGICVTIRRLHDLNRSGWWILIGLIPLIGTIIMLVWMASRGDAGSNRFGSNPISHVAVTA